MNLKGIYAGQLQAFSRVFTFSSVPLSESQFLVGFPLGLLDILDWLPYFAPDLRWSLGVVLIGSLLVHAYTGPGQGSFGHFSDEI